MDADALLALAEIGRVRSRRMWLWRSGSWRFLETQRERRYRVDAIDRFAAALRARAQEKTHG